MKCATLSRYNNPSVKLQPTNIIHVLVEPTWFNLKSK
jgi:hypothetical protein